MRRTLLLPLATAALALTAACADSATSTAPDLRPGAARLATSFVDLTAPSGAHYRNGFAEPTCGVGVANLTVSCTGTAIAGVGNTDADLVLTARYSATVRCRNHGGQIVDVKTQTTTATSADNLTDLRNGTLYVSAITATSPTTQSFLDAATCPNRNWTKLLLPGTPALASFTYTLTFHGFTVPAITVTG